MKQVIREQLKSARHAISEIERERKSHRIFDAFLKSDEYKKARNILVYISKGDEVVTHFMVKRLLSSGKTLYAPKVEGEALIASRLDHWEDLDFGAYGVLETTNVLEILHPQELDLVLVPGVGFTPNGDRIGLGKGYYDRFLKKTNAIKMGFAYDEQILEELPTEEHDVSLDLIITDKTIYRP